MSSTPPAPFPLITDRLILRSPMASDGPVYAAMMANPLNTEHDPEGEKSTDTSAEAYGRQCAEHNAANERGEKAFVTIALKNPDGTEGPVIGMGGYPFLPQNADGKPGNTGALIDSAHWRKGYASEALIATLDCGFDQLGFDVIEQTTHEANTAYRALMQAMGLDGYGVRQWSDKFKLWEMNYPVNRSQWQDAKTKLEAKLEAKKHAQRSA